MRRLGIGSWVRRLGRSRTDSSGTSPGNESGLREFVYLDDISVVSLLVSRKGELVDQVQESGALESTIGTELTVGGTLRPAGLNLGAKSNYQSKSSRSVQATKKANIQSQFRLFRDSFGEIIFPNSTVGFPASVEGIVQAANLCKAVPAIRRGDLVELKVRLRADPMYQMVAAFSEMLDMIDSSPSVFDSAALGISVDQARGYSRIFEQFLAGLVPIRSLVTNVRLWEVGGTKFLIDSAVAGEFGLTTTEVEVVGVLEKERFWKDIRRVLFSDAEVTILARVSVEGIQREWVPVKLFDVLNRYIPGGASAISELTEITSSSNSGSESRNCERFEQVLHEYVILGLDRSGSNLSIARWVEVARAVASVKHLVGSVDDRRAAFTHIRSVLGDAFAGVDSTADALLRQAACQRFGLSSFGEFPPEPPARRESEESSAQLLEVDVVAMYW